MRRFGRPQAISCGPIPREGELSDAAQGVRSAAAGADMARPRLARRCAGRSFVSRRRAPRTGRRSCQSLRCGRRSRKRALSPTSAANEKLAKGSEGQRRKRGRDDLAAAIVLAVAEGQRRETQQRWRKDRAACATPWSDESASVGGIEMTV